MNVLTVPINIRNVLRLRVSQVTFDQDGQIAYVAVQAINPLASIPYGVYSCQITNGPSQGVRPTVAPVGFTDCVEVFTTTVATGFTDVVAAYAGATIAARNRGVEQMMVTAGLMPAGVVS
ncbi:MAG TPA: hypothetical protein VE074_13945 [Jatrophihabitantaceae bacterium]|nr:hypothetical protein [Jatrophihabitantaceae bacterium]